MMNIRKLAALLAALIALLSLMASPAVAEAMKVEHTDAFSVEYLENDVKLICDAENRKFLLVPRGQEVPAGYEDAMVLETPIETALFCSTTQVGMLVPYGDMTQWVDGVTEGSGGWPFEEIEAGLADGRVTFVGSFYSPDYEMIQEMNPDISFVYTGSSPQTELIEKLEELGLPYAVDNEYMEATYEGRMEWTKFLAAFFDLDDQAVAYVDEQEARLAEMAETVKDADKPKVAWGMIYDGVVYVPNGDSYVARQIAAAGGDYVFKDLLSENSSSSQIGVEEFYETLCSVDVWIYSSNALYLPNYAALLELAPVVADAPVVEAGNVWLFDVDYYYNTHMTDRQVIDLAAIFHPELYPDYEVTQYSALAAE